MRVKCAGRGCEHARSSHDDDGRCRVCPTVPPDGRADHPGPSCRGWAERRPHAWREFVTATFGDWQDAYAAAFEAATSRTYRPGLIAEERRRERRGGRREVTDYAERHPAPTLRVVLEGLAGAGGQVAA